MRIEVKYGRTPLALTVDPKRLVGHYHGPDAVSNVAAAVTAALEAPVSYPPLRRALTPDDHVAVVLDAHVGDPGDVLVPVLDHILQMEVAPEAISLLCAEPGASDAWVEALPERLEDVHVEQHDPKDRRRLAYLATTGAGRRLYLNRTLVDADQVVVVSERRYDAILGYAGGETSLYPLFSDEPTRQEQLRHWHADAPTTEKPWPLRAEADEVAWLLGQPFYVQLIAAEGQGIAQVITGAGEAVRAAQRRLDAVWRFALPRRADVVVVAVSRDPAQQTFADLAEAAYTASRIVQPGGRIVLLSGANPQPGVGAETILNADEPEAAVQALAKAAAFGSGAALRWAQAVSHAHVSVLSAMPGQLVEDLFATPLDGEDQVQRLLTAGDCAILQDGERMVAEVA